MGMQVWVTGTGIVMIECGRDHPSDIHLSCGTIRPGCTDSRGCNLTLDECNHLRNRRMVRLRDQRLRPCIGNCPQHRRGLRYRERVIKSSYGTTGTPLDFLGFDLCELFRTGGGRQ